MNHGLRDASRPVIYVIDSSEHPFDLGAVEVALASQVVPVPVSNWNEALTPWPAEGLYRGEPDFGGRAARTLQALVGETIPSIEGRTGLRPRARGVCGYSLGGLFAVYALTHSPAFDGCACLSGSLWYEGWVEYLRALDVDLCQRYAFLSIGTKERRAARPILKTTQAKMEECAQILEQKGCAVHYQTGPGNHMQYVKERFAAGLAALDEFLASCSDSRPSA